MKKFTPDQLSALADLCEALMAHYPVWFAARQAAGADLTGLPSPEAVTKRWAALVVSHVSNVHPM